MNQEWVEHCGSIHRTVHIWKSKDLKCLPPLHWHLIQSMDAERLSVEVSDQYSYQNPGLLLFPFTYSPYVVYYDRDTQVNPIFFFCSKPHIKRNEKIGKWNEKLLNHSACCMKSISIITGPLYNEQLVEPWWFKCHQQGSALLELVLLWGKKERFLFKFLILWLFTITGGTVSGYTFFQTWFT